MSTTSSSSSSSDRRRRRSSARRRRRSGGVLLLTTTAAALLAAVFLLSSSSYADVAAAADTSDANNVAEETTTTTDQNEQKQLRRHVLVGYRDRDRLLRHANSRRLSATTNRGLDRVDAVKLELDDDELEALRQEQGDNLLYVEDDSLVKPLGEIVPYGVQLVVAGTGGSTLSDPAAGGAALTSDCTDPNSFKIGIVDSGADANHPDLPCTTENCVGREFGLRSNEYWYSPTDIHGTHVLGTIAALHNNGVGIRGVLPTPTTGFCFVIARVFGQSVENARLSDILDAVEWVAEQGAHVINLSLGGAQFSSTANNLYEKIRKGDGGRYYGNHGGTLVVSAAGNDGTSDRSYPASYTSVMSVGAVDADKKHASFSQHNDSVDVVAPGAGILSTVPRGLGSITTVGVDGTDVAVSGAIMGESVLPPEPNGISGILVECPGLGEDTCPGVNAFSTGHICIIARYVTI